MRRRPREGGRIMVQDRSEPWVRLGLSHGLRWLWGVLGIGGLVVFLLLAAMVGLSQQSPQPGTPATVLLSSSSVLATEVGPWRTTINQAAQATGVPAPWIAAEIVMESRGRAQAGTVGGAYGLMQIEPGTMGLTTVERANPTDNIMAGARYLAALHGLFHSWREASAAYYGGAGLEMALLPQVPMPWKRAQVWLNIVPNPGANTLTLAQYANVVAKVAGQFRGVTKTMG